MVQSWIDKKSQNNASERGVRRKFSLAGNIAGGATIGRYEFSIFLKIRVPLLGPVQSFESGKMTQNTRNNASSLFLIFCCKN